MYCGYYCRDRRSWVPSEMRACQIYMYQKHQALAQSLQIERAEQSTTIINFDTITIPFSHSSMYHSFSYYDIRSSYGVGQAFPATLSHSDWLSHHVIIPLNT